MKKILLIITLLFPLRMFSQQVIFCEDVDKAGSPLRSSSEFTIGEKGGFFKILVKLPAEVEASTVIFDVYSVDKDGKEVFNNTLRMETQPSLTWFYKEITFYKAGDYHVYVYDERDKLLGVGKVLIKTN